jgi:hypothetical protein
MDLERAPTLRCPRQSDDCPRGRIPEAANMLGSKGQQGVSLHHGANLSGTLQAFFADLEPPRRIGIKKNPADWMACGASEGECGVSLGA